MNKVKSCILPKLSELPPLIITQIIGYIPTKDIIKNVSLVSRQLNILSKDSVVQISVSFTSDSTPERAVQIFKQQSIQVKYLTIRNISEETQKVLTTQIKALKNLQKFKVVHSRDQTFKFTMKFFSQLFQWRIEPENNWRMSATEEVDSEFCRLWWLHYIKTRV